MKNLRLCTCIIVKKKEREEVFENWQHLAPAAEIKMLEIEEFDENHNRVWFSYDSRAAWYENIKGTLHLLGESEKRKTQQEELKLFGGFDSDNTIYVERDGEILKLRGLEILNFYQRFCRDLKIELIHATGIDPRARNVSGSIAFSFNGNVGEVRNDGSFYLF